MPPPSPLEESTVTIEYATNNRFVRPSADIATVTFLVVVGAGGYPGRRKFCFHCNRPKLFCSLVPRLDRFPPSWQVG